MSGAFFLSMLGAFEPLCGRIKSVNRFTLFTAPFTDYYRLDKIVLRNAYKPKKQQSPPHGNSQMPYTLRGFTLIELMIVIAIIGILASLAVSAYQTFTVRAQVAEGLKLASAAKVPIRETYDLDGSAPADLAAAGMSPNPTDIRGSYVTQIAITDGRLDITYGGPRAHADLVGNTLSLTPYVTAGETIIWRCGNAGVPPGGALLNGGANHQNATVDPRYLPSTCRQ